MQTNPELRSDYEKIIDNPFWIEYRKRLAAMMTAAATTTASMNVGGVEDMWSIAKNQGSYGAYRAALSLPETMVGPREASGK